MNKKNKKKNINKKIAIFVLLVFLFMPTFRSWAMQSSNYRIDEDSINFGGTDDSSSANYRLSDTMGEIGTGEMSTGCSSLSFDGSDDYVNAGNGSSFNTGNVMSISAWVKFTNLDYSGNTGGLWAIASKGNPDQVSPNYGFWFAYDNRNNRNNFAYTCFGNSAGGYSGGGNNFSGYNYTFSNNTWYHLAVVVDTNVARLYINGSQQGSDKALSGLQLYDLSDNFDIGRYTTSGSFAGSMDDILVYGRALSSSEISDMYQGKHISNASLVSRWGFNEGSGGTTYDATSNDNDGSISGATFSLNYPSSTCNTISAGYRQADASYTISISSPSDVTMSPSIGGISGGTGNGNAVWTVITDNPAGYEASIKSSTSPAMQSGAYSFANYTTSVAGTPDYNWSIASADSEFGFTVEGSYVVNKFLDNGSSACATGSSNTVDKCWYPFAISDETIISSSLANSPGGTATTVKFRAESGSGHFQQEGSYSSTITVTAVAL